MCNLLFSKKISFHSRYSVFNLFLNCPNFLSIQYSRQCQRVLCIYIYIYIYIHTHTHTYIYTYTYTYIYIYTHTHIYIYITSWVVQGQRAGLQYPSSRVQTRPKPSDFQGEKILSTPSFGGEVKPSLPCRRFAAYKRSLNLRGSWNLGKITGQFIAHSSSFRCQNLSRCRRTGTWWRKWERLNAGDSNGKLPPPVTCPGCSVPEPYRSHDWALVPASPASKAEY